MSLGDQEQLNSDDGCDCEVDDLRRVTYLETEAVNESSRTVRSCIWALNHERIPVKFMLGTNFNRICLPTKVEGEEDDDV